MSEDEEIFDERTWAVFAEGKVGCPACGMPVPVPVLACVEPDDEGNFCLELKPDMSEAWAHIFTHEAATS